MHQVKIHITLKMKMALSPMGIALWRLILRLSNYCITAIIAGLSVSQYNG
jgi:hypothetical protein